MMTTSKAVAFEAPIKACPLCGMFAICALPPVLLAKQPDDTTHVCHPKLGGCNHGFAIDAESDLAPAYEALYERQRLYTTALQALQVAKGNGYRVRLANRGNPDFRQDGRRPLPGVPNMTIEVATLADASKACRLYIEHHELGGGNWTGGEVTKGRTKVCRVSFNGRMWVDGKEIFDQPSHRANTTGGGTCTACKRHMTPEETGTVLPDELVCDQCAGLDGDS